MDPQGKYIITDFWVSYARPRYNWRACSWLMTFSLEMAQEDKDTRKHSDCVSWHQCPPLKDLKKSSLNYISLFKREDKSQWFHNTSFKLTILLFWGAPKFKQP